MDNPGFLEGLRVSPENQNLKNNNNHQQVSKRVFRNMVVKVPKREKRSDKVQADVQDARALINGFLDEVEFLEDSLYCENCQVCVPGS